MLKIKLLFIYFLLNNFIYAQSGSLKIIKQINNLLYNYSEKCIGGISRYTVQYDSTKKQVVIKVCKDEKKFYFNLKDVDIIKVDEGNNLNYSLYFKCLGGKKCISEEVGLNKISSELSEMKITLIFPRIVQDLVNYFNKLKNE